MSNVFHRLRSQRGASIIYALLLFLVAFMVSAVVVASSTSSLKSVHSDQAWKQESLELESAGRLIKQLVTNVMLVATTNEDGSVDITPKDASDPLAVQMCAAYNAVLTGSSDANKSWEMSIALNDDRFSDAYVEFTMYSPLYVSSNGADDPNLIKAKITLQDDDSLQCLYLYAHLPDPGTQTEFGWSEETATLTTKEDT